ncbi:MAG: glycosyltransferase family 4 protein [Candidatus Diapherotrites archaeon]|nr:glycosyltransferase family 4 protein [Candidatus Diapherotrites archaeon]
MISSSSFITTYPYAKTLGDEHDVVIVGPLFGKEPFVKDKALKFELVKPLISRPLQLGMLLAFFPMLFRLLKNDYDVVQAFKLLPHTAPAAAVAKLFTRKPLIITIDDYDAETNSLLKKIVLKTAELSVKAADAVTVSSKKLEEVYGEKMRRPKPPKISVIYQTANENAFNPAEHYGKEIRERLGLKDKIVVMYAGTVYDFKGVDNLVKAMQALKHRDVKLVVVGAGGDVDSVKKLAGKETIFVGRVPLDEMPDYVAACDIYAIPTKDTPYARAEIPGKIFEPMAMGKAIVASRISDIPTILDGAGVLVEPGNVQSLTDGLRKLLDEKARESLGKKARERYLRNYSYAQFKEKARDVLRSVA